MEIQFVVMTDIMKLREAKKQDRCVPGSFSAFIAVISEKLVCSGSGKILGRKKHVNIGKQIFIVGMLILMTKCFAFALIRSTKSQGGSHCYHGMSLSYTFRNG